MTYFKSEQSKEANRQGALKSGQIQKDRSDKLIEEYNKHPKCCLTCEEPIPYEKRMNKYCSRSCAASMNNRGVQRNTNKSAWINTKQQCQCPGCINKTPSPKRKYCSHKCSGQAKKYETKLRIQMGQVSEPRTLRNYLIEMYGNKCQICGREEWEGKKIPLVLDHINGDSSINTTTNLRMICPNCDAQTPTYKARNKGNGRHWRRQRYENGQSY